MAYDLNVGAGALPVLLRRAQDLGWECIARVSTPASTSKPNSPSPRTPGREQHEIRVLERVNLGGAWEQCPKYKDSHDLIGLECDASTTSEIFKKICERAECDLITINLSKPLRFHLSQSHVQCAVRRGVAFEILYSKVLHADESTRRSIFGNARLLCRSTRGKGLVLSSGTANPLDLRSPSDAQNLATLFGLKPAEAKAAVESTCARIVERAGLRRGFKRGFQLREKTREDVENFDENRVAGAKKPRVQKY